MNSFSHFDEATMNYKIALVTFIGAGNCACDRGGGYGHASNALEATREREKNEKALRECAKEITTDQLLRIVGELFIKTPIYEASAFRICTLFNQAVAISKPFTTSNKLALGDG